MGDSSFREGKAPFEIASRNSHCETYYKIYGDLHGGLPPLIVLHGGPGSGHEYVEPFSELWRRHRIPVVFYDQIGCASSTHLPETLGDQSFWQKELFVAELENLLDFLHITDNEFDILGHSWGGSLAVTYAASQPPKLRRLILANTTASSEHSRQSAWGLLKQLSPEHQQAVEEAIQKNDFTGKAYLDTINYFLRTHLCRAHPYPPPELAANQAHQAKDSTVRRTMQGSSPFLSNGSMEHWSNVPLLPKITVPTLVYNSEFDTAQDSAVVPFFDHIPRVRWTTFPNGSHMAHLDSSEMLEKVLNTVSHFLLPQKSS